MNIREKYNIRVYNESFNGINLVTADKEYFFEGSRGGVPTVNLVPFSGIEYANSRSSVFRTGMLCIDEADREEVFDALGIDNWKDTVWCEYDIADAILHPTAEKMKRILNVRDVLTIGRIRGVMYGYLNDKNFDVSNRVVSIIDGRFDEINSGKMTTGITIMQGEEIDNGNKRVDEVAKQNEELKKQVEKMQEMLNKLANVEPKNSVSKDDAEVVDESVHVADKPTLKRGRPKKN